MNRDGAAAVCPPLIPPLITAALSFPRPPHGVHIPASGGHCGAAPPLRLRQLAAVLLLMRLRVRGRAGGPLLGLPGPQAAEPSNDLRRQHGIEFLPP